MELPVEQHRFVVRQGSTTIASCRRLPGTLNVFCSCRDALHTRGSKLPPVSHRLSLWSNVDNLSKLTHSPTACTGGVTTFIVSGEIAVAVPFFTSRPEVLAWVALSEIIGYVHVCL